jgi:hypothetical protein
MRWGAPPLGELGWRGEVKADSAEVVALRETLVAEAGIQGLEIVDPAQPDFAQRAARLFHRDGFVLVKDALDPERLERVKCGCDHVIRKMLELDPERLGNRGSHRYSFGNSCAHFGAAAEWALMIDPPVVLAVIEAIFESPDFQCSGCGGDYVLPGCVEYQQLHQDMGDYLRDPSGRLDFRDMPCVRDTAPYHAAHPYYERCAAPDPIRVCLTGQAIISVNYPMTVVPGAKGAHTPFNGATRQIPGTQNSRQPIPKEDEECASQQFDYFFCLQLSACSFPPQIHNYVLTTRSPQTSMDEALYHSTCSCWLRNDPGPPSLGALRTNSFGPP